MRYLTRAALAGVATFAVGASALVAPQAVAEEAAAQPATTTVEVPLACNLQLKKPIKVLGQDASGAVEGVYNVGNTKREYGNFRFSGDVTAPQTVEAGEEFEYVIDFGALELPAQIKSAVTANVSKASQINLWVDLPENAEVVSLEPEAGNDAVSVTQDGNRIHFAGKDGADVTTWSKDTRNEFNHGGLAATKGKGANGKDAYLAQMPKVTLTLKAPETVGEEIRPTFNPTDANNFAPESFLQLYADASARVAISTIAANGFIRCGLSENDSVLKDTTAKPFLGFPAVKVVEPEGSGEEEPEEEPTEPEENPMEPKEDSNSWLPEINSSRDGSSFNSGLTQSSISLRFS